MKPISQLLAEMKALDAEVPTFEAPSSEEASTELTEPALESEQREADVDDVPDGEPVVEQPDPIDDPTQPSVTTDEFPQPEEPSVTVAEESEPSVSEVAVAEMPSPETQEPAVEPVSEPSVPEADVESLSEPDATEPFVESVDDPVSVDSSGVPDLTETSVTDAAVDEISEPSVTDAAVDEMSEPSVTDAAVDEMSEPSVADESLPELDVPSDDIEPPAEIDEPSVPETGVDSIPEMPDVQSPVGDQGSFESPAITIEQYNSGKFDDDVPGQAEVDRQVSMQVNRDMEHGEDLATRMHNEMGPLFDGMVNQQNAKMREMMEMESLTLSLMEDD